MVHHKKRNPMYGVPSHFQFKTEIISLLNSQRLFIIVTISKALFSLLSVLSSFNDSKLVFCDLHFLVLFKKLKPSCHIAVEY